MSGKIKTIKNDLIEILKLKNIVSKTENSLNGLSNRLETKKRQPT